MLGCYVALGIRYISMLGGKVALAMRCFHARIRMKCFHARLICCYKNEVFPW